MSRNGSPRERCGWRRDMPGSRRDTETTPPGCPSARCPCRTSTGTAGRPQRFVGVCSLAWYVPQIEVIWLHYSQAIPFSVKAPTPVPRVCYTYFVLFRNGEVQDVIRHQAAEL